MIPAQIEREILIDAPVDVVWRVLTQPDQIAQWFSDEAALDLRAGGQGRLAWTSGSSHEITVESVEPLRRFAFRWVYPEGSTPDRHNSTLVVFTLSAEARGTRLRVIESGFDQIDWSQEEMTREIGEHTRGWRECFDRLEKVVSRRAGIRGQA